MSKSELETKQAELLRDIRQIITQARSLTRRSVNYLQVLSNYLIGRRLVEEEQAGRPRAQYGKETLKRLAYELTNEFGRGYSQTNLEFMRKFYRTYSLYLKEIPQTLSEELAMIKPQTTSEKISLPQLLQTVAEKLPLSWSHYLFLMGISNQEERRFYELETAIIDKLEHFLLELGKGFLFEARQKRFSFDNDHFFIDLVFYNRLLRCYVIVDLKIGELKHQDLGQMQMYVNYFDRHIKLEDEQATIGIILCKKKKDFLVEITLPKEANIHAAKYQTCLPDKDALKKQMEEAQQEWERHQD